MIKKRGFTIIELMIVIAVMAILATVGFFTYTNVQKQARDSRRKAELKTIATALQAYSSSENDNAYPYVDPGTGGDYSAAANTALGALLTNYGVVPTAPAVTGFTVNNSEYTYASSDGSDFALCAALENGTNQMFYITSNAPGGAQTTNANCDTLVP